MLGESMLAFLQGRAHGVHDEGYVTALYHAGRAFIRRGKWKLVNLEPPFREQDMELFDLEDDPGETIDLSATEPGIFSEMLQLWRTTRVELGILLESDL